MVIALMRNRLKQNEGRHQDVFGLPTNFTVIIQMTPNFEGQAKNILMSALSGGYLHHKIAIAVDEDVDPLFHMDNLLDEHREIVLVEQEVDPDNNIGTLCHLAQERAIWMKNIKGHPGWTALAQAPANWRHLAMAFGIKQEELVSYLSERLAAPETDPVFLRGEPAPCQEKVFTGDAVDVRQLPVHLQSREDGGKCISASICIVKNPDTGRYNLSYHRMMPMGPSETGFLMLPRHMWRIYQKI